MLKGEERDDTSLRKYLTLYYPPPEQIFCFLLRIIVLRVEVFQRSKLTILIRCCFVQLVSIQGFIMYLYMNIHLLIDDHTQL